MKMTDNRPETHNFLVYVCKSTSASSLTSRLSVKPRRALPCPKNMPQVRTLSFFHHLEPSLITLSMKAS